jgi:hypothetical protein
LDSLSFRILCDYCPDDTAGFLPDDLKIHIAEVHPEYSFEPVEQLDEDIADFTTEQLTGNF